MGEVRNRSQTLLIVEGNHEKNELFWLIFKCFPEINIEMDIDLPFVISKKQTPGNLRYKDDFTNIILVFDYERHDTNFSERKILDMQNNFSDAADMGKLYINYPMIESYQHLRTIPDSDFAERKIPVSLQPGSKYKELVGKESKIGVNVNIKMLKKWKIKMYTFQLFLLRLCFQKGSLFPKTI